MSKKIFIYVIAFCLFQINTTFAQGISVNRIKFGIQASPSVSWLTTNDNNIKNNGTNLGFRLGVTTDYYFAENYSFTTGLGFAFNQGGKIIHETGGNFLPKSSLSDSRLNNGQKPMADGVNIRYHIQYLEIPFGMKFRTQQFGHMRYFAEAPIITLGFATQARGDIYNSGLGIDFLKENIKSDVTPLAFSWGFGGGINYDISTSTSAVAGIYYQRQVIDVTRDGSAAKATATGVPGQYTATPERSTATMGIITLKLGIIF